MCRDGMANGHYGMPRALLVVPKRFSFCLKYHTRGYDLNEGGLVYRYLASCYVTGALDPKAPRRYQPICCRFLLFISPPRRAYRLSRFRPSDRHSEASSCSADRLQDCASGEPELAITKVSCHCLLRCLLIGSPQVHAPAKATMKLNAAAATLLGISCARIPEPTDAFIFGHDHRQKPITTRTAPQRRINANRGVIWSASNKYSQRVVRSSPLSRKAVGNDGETGNGNSHEVERKANSDPARVEKDTPLEPPINADAAANAHQIIDDVDCYDLCEVFDEEVATEDSAATVEAVQNDISLPTTTKDTPADAVPSVSSMQSSSPPAVGLESNAPATRSPKDADTMRQNLELHWQISSSTSECDLEADIRSCSDACPTCHGTGRVECRFCGGTGFLTVGEMVMGGGKVCPICNHDGEEECSQCRGSGWVANWKQTNLTGLEP